MVDVFFVSASLPRNRPSKDAIAGVASIDGFAADVYEKKSTKKHSLLLKEIFLN